MRPAKTQINLGSAQSDQDPSFLHADSEDSDHWADAQADLSLRWAHSHFVGFVTRWLVCITVTGTIPGEFVSMITSLLTTKPLSSLDTCFQET